MEYWVQRASLDGHLGYRYQVSRQQMEVKWNLTNRDLRLKRSHTFEIMDFVPTLMMASSLPDAIFLWPNAWVIGYLPR